MRIVPYIVGTLALLGAVCFTAMLSGVPPPGWVIGVFILVRGIMGATDAERDARYAPPPGAINKHK